MYCLDSNVCIEFLRGNMPNHYGRIRASLELQGMVIGPNELVIAATCLAEGAVLVTDNVREFMRVEGLQIESWAEVPL